MHDFTEYTLIGAGGTGSHFIGPGLAYLNSWHRNEGGEWNLTIIDGDSYEAKNQERQMFDPQYIGMNKAQALANAYAQYPVHALPRFVGEHELRQIMDEGSVIFLGVDNYSVRALVEKIAYDINDIVIINAGNERHTGSVQLWVRKNGENLTPPISFLHPEIKYTADDDRSGMTCMQAAQLPGGEQLIIANMAAAQHMMTALWRYHSGTYSTGWTELQFDLQNGSVEHSDMRTIPNWNRNREIFVGAPTPETA